MNNCIFLITTFITLFLKTQSQTCLSSPEELVWNVDSVRTYSASITYGIVEYDGLPLSFRGRGFNHNIPGPTIRMRRGNTYQLTLTNELLPTKNENFKLNNFGHYNVTNIHTHGLYTPLEGNGDNIFHYVDGGESITYTYNIPCEHAGGTFWYHPHHHGSATIQVNTGSAGALIIEDDPAAENLPDWLVNMKELVLVMTHHRFGLIEKIDESYRGYKIAKNDFVTLYDKNAKASKKDFILINGEYKPTICLNNNEWTRLRIINSDIEGETLITIRECTLYLISKDSILIHGKDNSVPRKVNSIWLTASSRVDIAINCPLSSKSTRSVYEYTMKAETSEDGSGTSSVIYNIATIRVTKINNDNKIITPLTTFHPNRPNYLTSLINSDNYVFQKFYNYDKKKYEDELKLTIYENTPYFNINHQIFGGENKIQHEIDYKENEIIQLKLLNGNEGHPIHVHIYPFQIFDIRSGYLPQLSIDDNWNNVGDWLDTIQYTAIVRFSPKRWGGRFLIHCHTFGHGDLGASMVLRINGGCVGNYEPFDSNSVCNSTCSGGWELQYCMNTGEYCHDSGECCSLNCLEGNVCE